MKLYIMNTYPGVSICKIARKTYIYKHISAKTIFLCGVRFGFGDIIINVVARHKALRQREKCLNILQNKIVDNMGKT